MMGLTDDDARALVDVAAARIAEEERVNERFALNRVSAPPAVVQAALRSCRAAIEHGAVTLRIDPGDLRMLAPIADLIADLIDEELGEHVGFVMTC